MNNLESLDIWKSLGLADNPYNSMPVSSDELGEKLLVGREKELRALSISLLNLNIHPTLEGGNGVGKTSLVSVAGYRLFKSFEAGETKLVIPLKNNFQLTAGENLAEFRVKVLLQIVQALIASRDLLTTRGLLVPETSILEGWRRALRVVGNGTNEQNEPTSVTGSDIDGSELVTTIDDVKTWLETNFASPQAGFFLCVIDNLELLETSSEAKILLEEMRDEILNTPGLRWVLCGARGIVRSVASTGRLVGFLGDPINIAPVGDEHIEALIQARLNAFRIQDDVFAPVEVEGFLRLYHIGHKNLRIAMKYCQDFTLASLIAGEDFAELSSDAKLRLLDDWLSKMSESTLRDTTIRKRAWAVFDALAAQGGTVRPSDYPEFGFKSYQAMIPHLQSLSEANLIESVVDNADARKKTISMLPLGWVIGYQRSKITIQTLHS